MNVNESHAPDGSTCCSGPGSCIFTKALLSHAATCELSQRRPSGEHEAISCLSPTARLNCETLLALMRERSTFALKLPRSGAPLMHARALQLQCGGVRALRQVLDAELSDIHALVGAAQERHGSLADLPWDEMVAEIAAWQPRRGRHTPTR